MKPMVELIRDGDIAIIEIDNPPVNALSNALRKELLAAIQAVMADKVVRCAVLLARGKTFIAGADIREFDKPPGEVITNDICAALDAATKPVVAALHGTALGGGFEIAMACHARIMSPDGRVGLPETRIGMMPGAGGTQRLPRLAGAMAALDMVTTGRHVPADEALKLGLVDEIATDLRKEAMHRAHVLADAVHWPVVSKKDVPICDRAAFDAALASVKRRARGAIAPGAAGEAVAWAMDLPFDEGLKRERARAVELRGGPQCKALRHLFHADRVAARMPDTGGRPPGPWPLKHVGVIGGGTMGSGITIALLEAGFKVTMVETGLTQAAAAEARIRAVHARQIGSGRLTPEAVEDRLRRLSYTYRLERLKDADLVIEAIIEEMPAKQEVFRNLSFAVRRDCILASNTSRLDINRLADVVDAPERVVGLHFFSPAHVMRLLEIVRGDRTSPEVLATALALATRLKKQPVIAGVCDGFIGNRILSKWWAQCDFMLEEGAYPEEIDAALESHGYAMGPYAVADLAGLDIAWAGRKAGAATRDPRLRDVAIIDRLCEQGRFGQKTGKGWYDHTSGKRTPDPLVHQLIEEASAARGLTRRTIEPAEIRSRVLAAMVNEAAKCLAEGIALRPSDIDVVLAHGYGYPAWRGGPMHEADTIGLKTILEEVDRIHTRDGLTWEPAPLLQDLATTNRTFASLNG